MRKCPIEKLDLIFAEISKNSDLYLPVNGNGGAEYKLWQEGAVLSDELNTNRSPKDFFFPQMENLMEFKTEGKTVQLIGVTRDEEGKYTFDFSLLTRFMDMADRLGIKYFEIAHFFTQWGAECAAQVVATVSFISIITMPIIIAAVQTIA